MLWLTAFLFPSVAFHAIVAHDLFQAFAWTLLYGTSTCLHANPAFFHPSHPLTLVDKTLGHVITAAAAWSVSSLPLDWQTGVVWSVIAYVPCVYYGALAKAPQYDPGRWYPWHVSLHVTTVLGMHMLFCAKRRRRRIKHVVQ